MPAKELTAETLEKLWQECVGDEDYASLVSVTCPHCGARFLAPLEEANADKD